MSTAKDRILTYLLTPFSYLYGGIVNTRNKMFDWGILKTESFDVPVVSIGNITVGGTGKTPHVEYIIEYLSSIYNIGVLSRGYKRKTKGFVLATSKSNPDTIGDEPYQIYQKYGYRIKVAVCEKRCKGIKELLSIYPDINLILLDDAFQHRYVKPKVSVLLTDYNHPVYSDKILPLGRLREAPSSVGRADYVIVTKCPENLNPLDFRLISKNLDLFAFQKLFFSRYIYSNPVSVFNEETNYSVNLSQLTRDDCILLLTGVASPRNFIRYFKKFGCRIKIAHYPDHYDFTRRDMEHIEKLFSEMKGAKKLIMTTEKDAVRLANNPYYPQHLKAFTFYIPISVQMISRQEDGDFLQSLRASIDQVVKK